MNRTDIIVIPAEAGIQFIPRAASLGAILYFLAALLALAAPVTAAAAETAPPGYRLGIFPFMPPRQIVELFGPVAASMRATLTRPVMLESASTFPDFSRVMAQQAYDIALIQPFDYAEFVDKIGYLPLAQVSVPMVNRIYVRDNSRYRSIDDLRGTAVAMPPAEAATTRVTLAELRDHKLIPGREVDVRYFSSHDSCIAQVWAGSAAACGSTEHRVGTFEKRMQAKLHAIHDSQAIPPVLFVVHPRVPLEQRTRLRTLITGWSQTEAGRQLLNGLGFPGFIAARPADYAAMRNFEPIAAVVTADSPHANESLFGVFPYLPARQLAQIFAPALATLNNALGMSWQFSTTPSFLSFMKAVESARYDIIFIQPFYALMATEHGYLPLAGMKERLQGTFYVPEASPYRSIADFRGKEIAMPPVDSAMSHLGRDALKKAGLVAGRDITINYVGNHDACLQTVRRGIAAACVSTPTTLQTLPKDLTQGLRSAGETDEIPGSLFMAHRRLSPKVRGQLQAEIVGWKDSEAGKKALESLRFGELIPVTLSDYQRLKRFEAGH